MSFAFSKATLASATAAIAGDDAAYAARSAQIAKLTAQRNVVAGKIKTALGRAAFQGKAISASSAAAWLTQGTTTLKTARALPK